MVDIDVLSVANGYFEYLKKSCGTQRVSELKRLSVLPLLKDITDGRLSYYVQSNDAAIIDSYIQDCYSDALSTSPSGFSSVYLIYSGTSDYFPSNNVILNVSTTYLSTDERVISPQAIGKYFWIAVPEGVDIGEVANREFFGDRIEKELFDTFSTEIDGHAYTVYYVQSTIAINSTYLISFIR